MKIERRCHILGRAVATLFPSSFSSLGVSIIALLLATTFVFALPAGAEIYKWTDSHGDLHFTDDRTSIPKEFRSSITVDTDVGGGSSVKQDVDFQKILETLEKKQAEMPPGQVLSEQDTKALTEARRKLGR